ncbi:MAG TPA: c-type cytochrome biogenesis protein CcmI [Burkholderiales bacterium]|nr:c-type cytochrome biogenesis protein CcmI [Burkholderiales bacterium]
MTLFYFLGSLLVLLVLGCVLRPLFRPGISHHARSETANLAILKDQLVELESDRLAGLISQDQHASAKEELEHRVLEEAVPQAADKTRHGGTATLAGGLTVFIFFASFGLYAWIGTPEAVTRITQLDTALNPHEVDAMIAQLAERMKQHPEDLKGWGILARSYYALGRYAESAQAYEQLAKRAPADADVLADHADALAMSQGRVLKGRPLQMLQQALQRDPNQWKALMLLGSEAFERGDYATALGFWERLRRILPPEAELTQQLEAGIEEARNRSSVATIKQPPIATQSVSGNVQLAPQFRSHVHPEDSVFIFARAAEGSKLPLAVLRLRVKDLPAPFELSDAHAMRPDARLSQHAVVVIGARVSKSGNPMPQSGDFEGYVPTVKLGTQKLQLVIDRQIP